jgi:hypothetical protein
MENPWRSSQSLRDAFVAAPRFTLKSREIPHPARESKIISDHLGTVDGQDVGVMLFALHNQLSSLEVYSQAGSDKPFGLPKVTDLYSFDEVSDRQKQPPSSQGD